MTRRDRQRITRPPNQEILVLFWRSLGPYHVARAKAAADLFATKGVRTIAMELCDSDEMQQWSVDRATLPVEVRTIAPQVRLFNHLPSWAGRVLGFLDEVRPSYLAVAGYIRPEMRAALRWAGQNDAIAVLMSETKWDDRPRTWLKRAFAARHVRRAHAALVSGAPAGEYLVSLGVPRELIFRQYGAVDNDYFGRRSDWHRQKNAASQQSARRYFIVCSRLVEVRKNIVRMLMAYKQYREQSPSPPWDLVICGDGPDRAAMQEFVKRHGIRCVEFAGFQQAETLADYYAIASCFIHPAMNEAWGLVVNEAMAAGLPVLVSRRCGCAYDLVREGSNGWTFNPHDVDELAGLMARVAALPHDELAKMGAESRRVVAAYGTDRFAQGLLDAVEAVQRVRFRRNAAEQGAFECSGLQLAQAGVASDGPRYIPGSGGGGNS